MMIYTEYDSKTLQKLQALEKEMLCDFIQICEQNNIDYFAVGGTAIGTMRHQGFIPWDDDIDIGFCRDDYDRFLEITKKKYSDKYYPVNTETYPNYPLMTTRWIRRGTKYVDECFKNVDAEWGVFLDLYCFDNISNNNIKMKMQGWKAWFWNKLMIIKAVKRPTLFVCGWKQKIVYMICDFMNYILNTLKVDNKFLYKKSKKAATQYYGIKTERIGYLFDPTPFTSIVKRADIYPTQLMKFEDLEIRMPNNVDAYLIPRYGQYMKLPSKEKRYNHAPYILQFGDFETENS